MKSRASTLLACAATWAWLAAASTARASSLEDCYSDSNDRRIQGCTELIEMPFLDNAARSLAFARRALALSLKGEYTRALPDYDKALKLDPGSAMVLNNRAWVNWRLGRIEAGIKDAERSLEFNSASHHAWDTRAHLRQSKGDAAGALSDYEQAMRIGGNPVVKLYQCGLEAHGLYKGAIDGLFSSDLKTALEVCVERESCDPLPPDEECRNPTS